MVLYKRSGRLCIRISTLYNLDKEIWIQQRWEAPSDRAVALRASLVQCIYYLIGVV